MRTPRMKVDKLPPYHGLEWDKKIGSSDNPNFWKYGVANLVFLDHARGKKLVLDLGCGTGGSAFFVAERGAVEWVVGVDLVRDMIKVAKENAVDRGLDDKVCFLVCDGRHLPFRPSCFEVLMSRGDVFCFLVPLERTVQELKRVMKRGSVMVLEMDNRSDWKPGSVVSTGFRRMSDGSIAYVVETFTLGRDHRAISYIVDPRGKIARGVAGDPEFQEKGCKRSECPLRRVKEETVEVRRGVLTHWPTAEELCVLFREGGLVDVRVMGDGLLMKLFLDGQETIVRAMKADPELFFEIEKRLIPYLNPAEAPTMLVRATVP